MGMVWPTAGYLSYTVNQLMACSTARTIAPNTFAEVNKEVKLAAAGQKKKCEVPIERKARVVQYSTVNGV